MTPTSSAQQIPQLILAEPDMKKRLVELGGDPLIQTPEKFGADIAAETEKWKKVVEGAGLEKVQ